MAYRQWVGIENSSGVVGMAYSLNNGQAWTNQSNVNAVSPGELSARYPSAIGAGNYPFVCWTEYTGANSGVDNDADPLFAIDMLGFGGGWLTTPQLIGDSNNPEGMWMGCPDYSEESDGTGHINITYTTWREFNPDDVSSHNMYLYRSTGISDGSVTFAPAVKIIDALKYFEPGSADGSTTSDAMISIANNGIGYVANVAYWHPNDYADLVDNNAYHTFKSERLPITVQHGARRLLILMFLTTILKTRISMIIFLTPIFLLSSMKLFMEPIHFSLINLKVRKMPF